MKQMFEKILKEEARRGEKENEILKPDFQGSKGRFSAPSYNSFTEILMGPPPGVPLPGRDGEGSAGSPEEGAECMQVALWRL